MTMTMKKIFFTPQAPSRTGEVAPFDFSLCCKWCGFPKLHIFRTLSLCGCTTSLRYKLAILEKTTIKTGFVIFVALLSEKFFEMISIMTSPGRGSKTVGAANLLEIPH